MHFLYRLSHLRKQDYRGLALTILIAGVAILASAQSPSPTPTDSQPNQKSQSVRNEVIINKIFDQEASIVQNMHKYTPLVETYIQDMKEDPVLGRVPERDKYFLGRLVLDQKGVNDKTFQNKQSDSGIVSRLVDRLDAAYRVNYSPLGFMQLVFINNDFDNLHYKLTFVRQQFLGQVRTLVFDVAPRKPTKQPHFLGRIWAEDQDLNIVRMNGTFEPHTRTNFYFHFDSWRVNVQPGLWLPAYIYTEETGTKYTMVHPITMKGQVRLWGYDLKHSGVQSEMTDIQVESTAHDISDANTANEVVPVQSQHLWELEAENNVLDRMERAGLLAPPGGEVVKVLQTVVSNLEITNNLNIEPEVRCRVLLTTPLESFTIGHTIMISRGLLDVLPDEASLAMILSHELAHIALGHRIDTRYAFSDRLIFPDENIFRQIEFGHKDSEEHAAEAKSRELLAKSPYKDKLASADLFQKALAKSAHGIPWLVSTQFGSRIAQVDKVTEISGPAQAGTALKETDLSQLPALPLGSRVKMDPWDDHVELLKSKSEVLLSPQDKMSFQVTPIYPNLVRLSTNKTEVATQQSTSQQDNAK